MWFGEWCGVMRDNVKVGCWVKGEVFRYYWNGNGGMMINDFVDFDC